MYDFCELLERNCEANITTANFLMHGGSLLGSLKGVLVTDPAVRARFTATVPAAAAQCWRGAPRDAMTHGAPQHQATSPMPTWQPGLVRNLPYTTSRLTTSAMRPYRWSEKQQQPYPQATVRINPLP